MIPRWDLSICSQPTALNLLSTCSFQNTTLKTLLVALPKVGNGQMTKKVGSLYFVQNEDIIFPLIFSTKSV